MPLQISCALVNIYYRAACSTSQSALGHQSLSPEVSCRLGPRHPKLSVITHGLAPMSGERWGYFTELCAVVWWHSTAAVMVTKGQDSVPPKAILFSSTVFRLGIEAKHDSPCESSWLPQSPSEKDRKPHSTNKSASSQNGEADSVLPR